MKETVSLVEYRQLQQFVQRWTDKANANVGADQNSAYDKFIALYIVYAAEINVLKDEQEKVDGRDIKYCVREAAKYLSDDDNFIAALDMHAINLGNQIEGGIFRLTLREENDPKLLRTWTNQRKSKKNRLQALLCTIYFIRCNMFHGMKDYTPYQVPVLEAANQCMEIINHKLLCYIETLVSES